jgi:copper chaperone CopZ
MNTITLPTTLHCAGCISAIKPVFNSAKKVKDWKVDLTQPVKTITVTGEGITDADVTGLLQQAGYDVMQNADKFSAELPLIGAIPAAVPLKATTALFWSDAGVWNRAAFNTLNCLIGCSIGDFGTVIFLQAFYPGTSMYAQMLLATIVGLCTSVMLETTILRVREGFAWRAALTTAMSMSFISMVTMEIAMNISDFMVTGGKAAFNSPQYWTAFGIAAVAGFLAPLPYNYFKLKKYNKSCH